MGMWCCLSAFCHHKLLLLATSLVAVSVVDLLMIVAGLGVLAVIAFFAFIKLTTEPYPEITIYPSEKKFVAYDQQGKEEEREWELSLSDEADKEIGLSLIIPAYNEEERLPTMLDEALEFLANPKKSLCPDQFRNFEVIVVDDGSKDRTTKLALDYAKSHASNNKPGTIRVLTLAKNLGKGGAVRKGMLVSRGSTVMYADADGATTFSELSKVAAKLEEIRDEQGHGLVCGSRAHLEQESVAQRSLFRTVLMYGFHACVRIFGGTSGVQDTQCGFKVMTRATASRLFHSLHIERWAFDVELIKMAGLTQIPVAEVAVEWTEIDGSKLDPLSASLQMLKDLFLLWTRYFLGAWKMREATPPPIKTRL